MSTTNLEKLVSMIFTTSRLIRERTGNQEKIDPFSILQLETLRYVDEKENPSMRELADYLYITAPSATSLIDTLVKSKRLLRIHDKDDRRLVRFAVTPKGKEALVVGFKKITKRMQAVLINLSEKERVDLIMILEKLSQSYSK
jgi:Transcriptional regulators